MADVFRSHLFRKEGNVWDIAIYVSKEIATPYIDKDSRRIICTVYNFSYHAALMPQGNGDFFININGEIRKKLNPIYIKYNLYTYFL